MLVEEEQRRERLGRAAIEFMENTYRWERFGSQVMRLHESLLTNGMQPK
jgi:hypothetical protein